MTLLFEGVSNLIGVNLAAYALTLKGRDWLRLSDIASILMRYVPAAMSAPAAIVALLTVPLVETLVGENPTLKAVGRLLAYSTAVSEYSDEVPYVSDASVLCALQTV